MINKFILIIFLILLSKISFSETNIDEKSYKDISYKNIYDINFKTDKINKYINLNDFYENLDEFKQKCKKVGSEFRNNCYKYVSYFWVVTGIEPKNKNCILNDNELETDRKSWLL